MSAVSLRIIDAREDHFHRPDHNRNVAWTLKKAVRNPLVVDKSFRAEVVAEDIGV